MSKVITDSERIIVLEQQIKKIIADQDVLQNCVNAHAKAVGVEYATN